MPAIFNNKGIINNILHDYSSGLSKKDLGKKYKLSQPTIRRVIKENINDNFPRIPNHIVDEIKLLSKYTRSKTSIAKKLGIDKNTVKRVLEYYEIILPIKTKPKPKPKAKSKYELLTENYNPETIQQFINKSIFYACNQTGFSYDIITKYIQEYNLSYVKPYKNTRDIPEHTQEKIVTDFIYTLQTKKEIQEKYNISLQNLNAILKSNKAHTKLVSDERFEEFLLYTKLVRRLTTVVKNHYNMYPGKGYHVDHIISVYDGFIKNIPPYIIASRENLRIITYKENLEKGTESALTKAELYNKIGI